MKVKYHKNMDSMEVMFTPSVPSLGMPSKHDAITIFKHKKTKKIVGYFIEAFAKHIALVMSELELTLAQKIAILISYERAKLGLSQEEASELIHVSMSTYRRIEAGENFSMDVLENIISRWPKPTCCKSWGEVIGAN